MACMCGDTCCPSCGPAQGNSHCPLCGSWLSEGCEHYLENGEPNPAFDTQFAEEAKTEQQRINEEAEYYAELEAMAKSSGWRIF